MIGYKLFSVRKDGTLGSLFINRRTKLVIGKTYKAEKHQTKGFALRVGWHICSKPCAPHLSMKNRKWYKVEFRGKIQEHLRPKSQGGLWYTAKYLKIISKV